jgi:multiple sugar transport system ATP-binding protein
VAMGRAIVREPKAFLMDEPLSSLDALLRVQTRAEVLSLQRELGVTTLYVTHDQVEAMTMGDRVAVMRNGNILQCAPPQQLYDMPANVFVAAFIGSPKMNIFQTILLTDADGYRWVKFGTGHLLLHPQYVRAHPTLGRRSDGPITVGARPESFAAAPTGADRNTIDVTVTAVEMLGMESLAYFSAPVQVMQGIGPTHRENWAPGRAQHASVPTRENIMCARLAPPLRLARGAALRLVVDTRKFYFFDQHGDLIS